MRADQPGRRLCGQSGRRQLGREWAIAERGRRPGVAQALRRAQREIMTSLDLALIGNSSVAALIDANGTIVWSCLPRFDSDAVFCALLRDGRGADDYGFFEIDLADFARTEQASIPHTPILKTRLFNRHGGGATIAALAPPVGQFS